MIKWLKNFVFRFGGSIWVILLIPYNLSLAFFIVASDLDKYVKQRFRAAQKHNQKIFRS